MFSKTPCSYLLSSVLTHLLNISWCCWHIVWCKLEVKVVIIIVKIVKFAPMSRWFRLFEWQCENPNAFSLSSFYDRQNKDILKIGELEMCVAFALTFSTCSYFFWPLFLDNLFIYHTVHLWQATAVATIPLWINQSVGSFSSYLFLGHVSWRVTPEIRRLSQKLLRNLCWLTESWIDQSFCCFCCITDIFCISFSFKGALCFVLRTTF